MNLVPHLPGDPLTGEDGAVSAARYGSPLILPITWAYIAMMGAAGLREATQVAILNANYVAQRLGDTYPVLYTGAGGHVAHECILDTREMLANAGLTVDDVAKRLIDYGYHAPTMSFPVPGTLMVEPTESESRAELDRFCDAMLAIHAEIVAVTDGSLVPSDSSLCNAPHTAAPIRANRGPSRRSGCTITSTGHRSVVSTRHGVTATFRAVVPMTGRNRFSCVPANAL